MREYDDYSDDSIRLYTPILQRVIILAAVIIAVPVVMWTITTFVRSYVARPRVPALEHVASTIPSIRVPLTAAPSSPAPPPDQSSAPQIAGSASDTANAAADMKQATGNLAALPSSGGAPGVTNSPSSAVQAAPMQAVSPASTAATGDASPASLARQSPLQAPRPNDGAALSAGASSSDRGIAWPNPNATNLPDFAGPRLASPTAPPARTAAAEVIPAGDPLSGPVPLPRHRPSIFAMAASMAGTTTGTIAGPVATGGPVPLPRARPGDAPAEAANSVIEPAYGYRPGLDADR
jgi:hypothetical protein